MGVFKEVDIMSRDYQHLQEEAESSRQLHLQDLVLIEDKEEETSASRRKKTEEWFFAYWGS